MNLFAPNSRKILQYLDVEAPLAFPLPPETFAFRLYLAYFPAIHTKLQLRLKIVSMERKRKRFFNLKKY